MAKSKPFDAAADPFGPFKAQLDALKTAIEKAESPFRPLITAFDAMAEKLKDSAGKAFAPLKPLTDAMANLGKAWKDALKPIADFRVALNAAMEPLRAAKGAFDTLTAPVRAFLTLPGKIAGAVGDMAGKAAGMLAAPSSQLQAFFGRVQGVVGSLVAKFAPGEVLKFQFAVDDALAALGSALVPTLRQFTVLVRQIGGALNGLSEEGKRLVAGLAAGSVGMAAFGAAALALQTILTGGLMPVLGAVVGAVGGMALATGQLEATFRPFALIIGGAVERIGGAMAKLTAGDGFAQLIMAFGEMIGSAAEVGASILEGAAPAMSVFGEVLRSLQPAIAPIGAILGSAFLAPITLIGKAVEAVGPALVVLTQYLVEFGKAVFDIGRQLLSFFGLSFGELGPPRSSNYQDPTGLAAKSTSTTDVLAVLAKAREASFSAGRGSQNNYPQQTATGVTNIAAEAKLLREKIERFISKMTPEAIGQAVAGAIKEGTSQAARAAGSTVTSPTTGGTLLRAGLTAWNPAAGIASTAAATARAIFGR